MWAEAAVPRYSAVSQHVLGWGRGGKKQPNPVAVLQDLEADKNYSNKELPKNAQRAGNCCILEEFRP